MTKIVLFNGPPSSGKDTIANKLLEHIKDSIVVKFASPLKTAATHIYCNGNHVQFQELDKAENKNLPNDIFLGKSCRQVQIDISEVYMKPMHGKDVFGKLLSNKIESLSKRHNVFFVSDSGFAPEAEVLINKYGAENVLLIRLIRPGFDYQKDPTKPGYDSRTYINLDEFNVKTINVENKENKTDETTYIIQKEITNFIESK